MVQKFINMISFVTKVSKYASKVEQIDRMIYQSLSTNLLACKNFRIKEIS